MSNAAVTITLSQDHALVLYEWLERAGGNEDGWIDQAEQRAVWDLAATLETLLPVFAVDYRELVRSARDRVRDAAD